MLGFASGTESGTELGTPAGNATLQDDSALVERAVSSVSAGMVCVLSNSCNIFYNASICIYIYYVYDAPTLPQLLATHDIVAHSNFQRSHKHLSL